jgi:hypothetical protein
MGKGGLRRLRQQNGDAIAVTNPLLHQQIGGLIGQPLNLQVRISRDRPALALIDERRPIGIAGPFIAHVDADVVVLRDLPAELPVQSLVGVLQP